MNKPYENSENLVLAKSDIGEIIEKMYRHVVNCEDPAQALYNLLDYDDEFPFSYEECKLAVQSKRWIHSMANIAIKKHYRGASIQEIIYNPPIDKYDPKEKRRIKEIINTKIDHEDIKHKYNKLKERMYRKTHIVNVKP